MPRKEVNQIVQDLVRRNKDILLKKQYEFRQTFGIPLAKFWHPIFGFDVVAFDTWLGTPDGISTYDYLRDTKGPGAVTLVESLI